MFSPDSAVDGGVLKVVLRKEDICNAMGVTVPILQGRFPVTDVLLASNFIAAGRHPRLALDLYLDEDATAMETR